MRSLLHCWVSVCDLLEFLLLLFVEPDPLWLCAAAALWTSVLSLITNGPYLGYPCPNSDCMCELM